MSAIITPPPPPVKRRRHAHRYSPPTAPDVEVEYTYHAAQKATGEWNYSLGDSPQPEHVEIERVVVNGVDIMGWLDDHGFKWERLESEILEAHTGQ